MNTLQFKGDWNIIKGKLTQKWANLKLSADRALRTHRELTQRYLVPSAARSAHGYGEMFPAFPEGTEEQMALDRRVLVVRKQ
jgi:outer membrane protein OmpA-like peptidoglycan-associated protein